MRDGSSGAIRLDTETGLAPVSSLGVVPVRVMSVSCAHSIVAIVVIPVSFAATGKNVRAAGSSYLMVLPVLRRIH